MTALLFDDDLFDAELILDRTSGAATFRKEDVAAIIGCSSTSVWHFVKNGTLSPPDHYEDMVSGGRRAVWMREQMVRLIMEIHRRRAMKESA